MSILKNMSLDIDFSPFTKVNSKYIVNLSVKYKAIKLLEEKWEKIWMARFVDAKPHAGGNLRRHEELSSPDGTEWDAVYSEMCAIYHS